VRDRATLAGHGRDREMTLVQQAAATFITVINMPKSLTALSRIYAEALTLPVYVTTVTIGTSGRTQASPTYNTSNQPATITPNPISIPPTLFYYCRLLITPKQHEKRT